MKKFDVVILTDNRYAGSVKRDWYSLQVMLEDELINNALKEQGLRSTVLSWQDPEFDWSNTHSVLFSSTWDYFDKFGQFEAWFNEVQEQCICINPAKTIRWNMDKHYLLDLKENGIRTVHSEILKRGKTYNFAQELESRGISEGIIKPTVSGAARHTYRVNSNISSNLCDTLNKLLEKEDFIIQPFQKNIVEQGELSLMVMGGKFTHAVRKVAAQGDFRVQDDHGGRVIPYFPSNEEINFAESAVRACDPEPLYARVDIVVNNDGDLAIMELELIEPELFLRFCAPAAKQLAVAVNQYLKTQS
ncbi:ATP-grasp domain-containing protein [Pleionea litopenaei]|uniref:Glutathione synthetase-like protein n=1 Tax=Pleionea litopenaei TaxID=3070815 RepID=A0AA51RUK4_9GAMM|nr:hypothetical protein [Pleionea sp. HL-JVS1]WMS87749.1 hypothetical protein Q9312_02210 [Pleionea sp. HL-JVS1]